MSLHDAHQTEMYYINVQKGLKEGNLNIMTSKLTHDEILEARTSLDKNVQVSLSKDQWESVQYHLKEVDHVRFSAHWELIDEIVTQTGIDY